MHTYMHMRMRMLFASTTNVYPAYPAQMYTLHTLRIVVYQVSVLEVLIKC